MQKSGILWQMHEQKYFAYRYTKSHKIPVREVGGGKRLPLKKIVVNFCDLIIVFCLRNTCITKMMLLRKSMFVGVYWSCWLQKNTLGGLRGEAPQKVFFDPQHFFCQRPPLRARSEKKTLPITYLERVDMTDRKNFRSCWKQVDKSKIVFFREISTMSVRVDFSKK